MNRKIKEDILLAMYAAYDEWCDIDVACQPGCAACCTQNVNITALEGDRIHAHVRQKEMEEWLAAGLSRKTAGTKAGPTTNAFAGACLEGREIAEPAAADMRPCPFLAEEKCHIYPVRPFACRCFASQQKCVAGGESMLPSHILTGATVVVQLIEHLGQGDYWGNMQDVLLALVDQPENEKVRTRLVNPKFADYGRARLVAAQPLPGFLIPPEEQERIRPLLDKIFSQIIDGKSVEDHLNGR